MNKYKMTDANKHMRTHMRAHTYTQSSRPSLLQAVVCRKHTPISMGLGTAG